MKKLDSFAPTLLVLATGLLFLGTLGRGIGLYPGVMADEYYYNLYSRLSPLASASIPDYLYYILYGITDHCGDGHLECARVMNGLFFFAATPFIYQIVTRLTEPMTGALATLLALIGPVNSYVSYLMPESLYFLGFWVTSGAILTAARQTGTKPWTGAGFLLGMTALIKPHALLMLPGLVVFIAVVPTSLGKRPKFKMGAINALLFSMVAIAVKLIGGMILAGEAGFSLFGSTYGGIAAGTIGKSPDWSQRFDYMQTALGGHLLFFSLFVGPPLILSLRRISDWIQGNAPADDRVRISLYTLLILSSLSAAVVIFTVSVAGTGAELPNRIHLRYYSFAVPLFYLLAASELRNKDILSAPSKWNQFCVLVLSFGALFALVSRFEGYALTHVDCPEIRGIQANTFIFYFSAGLLCISTLIGLASFVWSIRFYLLALPLALILGTLKITEEQRSRLIPDTYDRAGLFTRITVPSQSGDPILVVGPKVEGVYRALYHLDSPHGKLLTLSEGSKIPRLHPYERNEWVLAIGDYSHPNTEFSRIPGSGFTLYYLADSIHLDFRDASWPGLVATTSGLSTPEPWGTWSDGETVTFEFTMPLPAKLKISLNGRTFESMRGRNIELSLGSQKASLNLDKNLGEATLILENPDRDRTLKLFIDRPASPASMSMSQDQRRLGIGLVSLVLSTEAP